MEDHWQVSKEPSSAVTVEDLEHPAGARITLERNGEIAPFEITCGIYGWFVHTLFFSELPAAQVAITRVKSTLEHILHLVRTDEALAIDAIDLFVATH